MVPNSGEECVELLGEELLDVGEGDLRDLSGASLYSTSPEVRRGYKDPDCIELELDEASSGLYGRWRATGILGSTWRGCLSAGGSDLRGIMVRIALFMYSGGAR